MRALFIVLSLTGASLATAQPSDSLAPVWRSGILEWQPEASLDCGYYTNRDLYASFGYEQQLFSCRELTLGLTLTSAHTRTKLVLAPIYEALRFEPDLDPENPPEYGPDPDTGQVLVGGSLYRDWYNNLGDRVYFLGSVPVLDAWIELGHQQPVRLGRMPVANGLPSSGFWQDNAAIGPMSDWLVREYLAGALWRWQPLAQWQLELGLFSGDANPLKGYALYGAGSLSASGWGEPNRSSNNTPTYNARVQWQPNAQGLLFASLSSTHTGSTWAPAIDPSGKHNRHLAALGFDWTLPSQQRLYGQYTLFVSGLTPRSAQNKGQPMYRDIRQQGGYITVEQPWRDWRLGLGFEQFDRYDFNVFALDDFVFAADKAQLQQRSVFAGLIWQASPELSWHFLAHQLDNPLPNASQIYAQNPEFGAGLRYNIGFRWQL